MTHNWGAPPARRGSVCILRSTKDDVRAPREVSPGGAECHVMPIPNLPTLAGRIKDAEDVRWLMEQEGLNVGYLPAYNTQDASVRQRQRAQSVEVWRSTKPGRFIDVVFQGSRRRSPRTRCRHNVVLTKRTRDPEGYKYDPEAAKAARRAEASV